MRRQILLLAAISLAMPAGRASQLKNLAPALHPSPTRTAPDDLEVTGLISGLAPGASEFIPHADLARLPQITTKIGPDENFADTGTKDLTVTGIPLTELAKALGASPEADLISALCTDGYETHYTRVYLAQHQPIFALAINGMTPAAWAKEHKAYDPGPYFITHAKFVPKQNVLSHKEQPQIPANLSRLTFTTEQAVYFPIRPRVQLRTAATDAGFTIAKQSCLRCHAMGPDGGTKSKRDWYFLSTMALNDPARFATAIQQGKGEMPKNPTCDEPTLKVLQDYFRSFAEEHP